MVEENKDQEIRLKNIDETRIYLIKDIKQNELMSNKHKMFCATLHYIKLFYDYWMFQFLLLLL